jgi:hypothetical protein
LQNHDKLNIKKFLFFEVPGSNMLVVGFLSKIFSSRRLVGSALGGGWKGEGVQLPVFRMGAGSVGFKRLPSVL